MEKIALFNYMEKLQCQLLEVMKNFKHSKLKSSAFLVIYEWTHTYLFFCCITTLQYLLRSNDTHFQPTVLPLWTEIQGQVYYEMTCEYSGSYSAGLKILF